MPGEEEHFMKALFYAFGGNSGKMAIFNVSFVDQPKLRSLVSIPYLHLHGACSDPAGHVFVTQHGASGPGKIIEFAHGGTTAIATIKDGGQAMGCAYDRSTGNLAVVNVYDPHAPGGPGPDIAVYADERGTPTLYADGLSDSVRSCSYDLSGNLYIGGAMRHGHFVLAELSRGSSSVKAITIDGKIGGEYRSEDVQWHHGFLYVTSVDLRHDHGTRVFILNVAGSTGTVQGTIQLHKINPNEKAYSPWTVVFAGYEVTTDRIGVASWRIPLHCTGSCFVGRGSRHLLRVAGGFVSVAASAIRPREGDL